MKSGMIFKDLDLRQLVNEIGSQHFIKVVMDNLGSSHSLIRENMMGVHDRLIEEGHLSKEECSHLFNTSLCNLFKGLGGKGDDSVFCRSFSSLSVAFIVEMDEKRVLLSHDQYKLALDKAIDYMGREVDRRGFVMGKGWAHAPAHGADMLGALAAHPNFPLELADRILDCIKFHITSSDSYIDGEEERLADIIPVLLERGYSELDLQNWIKSLLPNVTVKPYSDEEYQFDRIIFNSKYFLMALYYTLGEKPKWETLRKFISQYEPTMFKLARSST